MANQQVMELASRWLGGQVVSAERFLEGAANQTFLLTLADGQRRVFRWYEPDFSLVRDAASIGYEHEVLRRLAARGLPVPTPILWEGSALGEADSRFYAVLDYLPGRPVAFDDATLMDHAAAALAGVHRATDAVRALGQRPGFHDYDTLDWVVPGRPAMAWLAALDGLTHAGAPLPWQELQAALTHALAELARIGYANHPRVLVHGDVNDRNLLQLGGRLTGIVDFDFCHLDSPAFDVAGTIWQICRVPASGAFDWDAVRRLVRAYQRLHPIPVSCYEIVPAAMRAWLLVLYLWSTRRLVSSGEEREARRLARSTGPSRLGLVDREEEQLVRVVTDAARGARG